MHLPVSICDGVERMTAQIATGNVGVVCAFTLRTIYKVVLVMLAVEDLSLTSRHICREVAANRLGKTATYHVE